MALPTPKVELKIGPPGAINARHWTEQYIKFRVKRTPTRKPNTAQVKIWNLGPDSIEYLKTKGLAMILLAGDDTASQIFRGDVGRRGILTKRQGPNLVTTIKAGDGRRIWRDSWFSKSYPPATTRDQMLNDLIAILGAPLGGRGAVPPLTFAGPTAFNSPARDALTELLAVDQSGWNIQDGAIWLFAQGEPAPGNAILVSTETGLMGSPTITDKGVNFSLRLRGEIKERSLIQLRSKEFTGALRAVTVNHDGDSYARSWASMIQAKPL